VIRVHGIYDVEGWAYERRLLALKKYAPDDIEFSVGDTRFARDTPMDYDLVFLLCYGQCKRIRQHLRRVDSKALLMAGYNCGWGYRGEYYHELQQHADHVLFNNHENWIKHGKPLSTAWISNGVDRDVFNVQSPIADRSPRALWCGSEFHIKNNDVKNYLSLLRPLADRLERVGIASDFHVVDSHGEDRRTAQQMAAWYNTGTIYVVASDHEGTPNPALEAAACGCTVVSVCVGNMPELIEHRDNGVLVDRTLDDLFAGVQFATERYPALATAMQQTIEYWDWKYRAQQYFALFRKLIR